MFIIFSFPEKCIHFHYWAQIKGKVKYVSVQVKPPRSFWYVVVHCTTCRPGMNWSPLWGPVILELFWQLILTSQLGPS